MIIDIGNRIAEIRRERGLNQDELAELATLSRISIARYETGKIEPGAKALGRIADALEVSADHLLGRTTEQKTASLFPQTIEARIIARAIDRMPKEQREKALNVIHAMFSNHPEYFEKTTAVVRGNSNAEEEKRDAETA